MLPSNKKRKFVSTPRQGTEKDLERATQAASRIELFIVTKSGGGGLSQDNTRSGNKTLQCMLAALAKVEGIDVEDPRSCAMKRARGGNEYQGHLFSVTEEHAEKLLGSEKSVERELVHDAHFFDGKEDTIKTGQRAVVVIAKYEEIHAVSLPGAPAGSFATPDARDVLVGARVRIAPAALLMFADSADVRAMVSEALAWSIGEDVLGQLTEEGKQGWTVEVAGARTAEEITGTAGQEAKMRHGANFDVRLHFDGEVARMSESALALPLHVSLPTTIKVDPETLMVSLPDQETEAGSWSDAEISWTGPPVRGTRLVQVTGPGSGPGALLQETRNYMALGGEESAALLAQAINASPGGRKAETVNKWERGSRSSGGERRKLATERRATLVGEVQQCLKAGLAEIVRGEVCATATGLLALEAVTAHGGSRQAVEWAEGVVSRARISMAGGDPRWNPGQEWAKHVCGGALTGCGALEEPCAAVWQLADARRDGLALDDNSMKTT
jgi:hypothetical protein